MSTRRQQPAGSVVSTDGSPSPYVIGAAIGLLNIFAFATFRKGIGVSGAYESSAALVARRVAPEAAHVNDYVKARKEPPSFNWESWLVLGTVLGGMAAGRAFVGRADSGIDDFDGAEPKRSALAGAAGGALLMFGARMADGCTSGHALSGTAQGAGSSWLFTPVMFGVGSLLARRIRDARLQTQDRGGPQ